MAIAAGMQPADAELRRPGPVHHVLPELVRGLRLRGHRDRRARARGGDVDRGGQPVHAQHLGRVPAPDATPARGVAGRQDRVAGRQGRRRAVHPAAADRVRDRPAAARRRVDPADAAGGGHRALHALAPRAARCSSAGRSAWCWAPSWPSTRTSSSVFTLVRCINAYEALWGWRQPRRGRRADRRRCARRRRRRRATRPSPTTTRSARPSAARSRSRPRPSRTGASPVSPMRRRGPRAPEATATVRAWGSSTGTRTRYLKMVRAEVPDYDRVQDEVARATEGVDARRVLELGTGSGVTSRRVLERHPHAQLTGVDSSEHMLAAADLPGRRPAPAGPARPAARGAVRPRLLGARHPPPRRPGQGRPLRARRRRAGARRALRDGRRRRARGPGRRRDAARPRLRPARDRARPAAAGWATPGCAPA